MITATTTTAPPPLFAREPNRAESFVFVGLMLSIVAVLVAVAVATLVAAPDPVEMAPASVTIGETVTA